MPQILLRNVRLNYPGTRALEERRLKSRIQRGLGRLLGGDSYQPDPVRALRDVNFTAKEGDIVGVVGANGAGKTSLLRVIAGLLAPDSGSVQVRGRVSTVFNLGAGFIPSLSGRENIHLVGTLHGFSQRRVAEIEESIIKFSDLGGAIDRPLKTYSSGMRSRLGFSIVANLDTEIVALDEALAVGDYQFRRKAGNLIERFVHDKRILVVVSHSPRVIIDHCSFAYCLAEGRMVAEGDPADVCRYYRKA